MEEIQWVFGNDHIRISSDCSHYLDRRRMATLDKIKQKAISNFYQ